MNKKKLFCSNCKESIGTIGVDKHYLGTCDSGWSHKFKLGDKIICKKKKWPEGSLHFCDEGEMEEAILDPDIPVRTFGKEATVIKEK